MKCDVCGSTMPLFVISETYTAPPVRIISQITSCPDCLPRVGLDVREHRLYVTSPMVAKKPKRRKNAR